MNLDWDKLRIFHTVAEAGSFTHAGDALNLSQSAVSRQISTLESQLGVSLFHRHARGLLLTEQGELLLKTTQSVYEKLAIIEGQMSDTKTIAEGPLKITVPGFLGSVWLAPKIHQFMTEYPKLKLTFILDNKILNLSMREADAAIRLYEPDQADLIKRKLTTIHFHICAAKSYLKEHGTPKTPADLRRHFLIGYPPHVTVPHEHTDWLFNFAGVDKETAPNTLLINSMQAIHKTVDFGSGIACLPDFMIANSPNIEPIMTEYQAPAINVFFVYPEERRNSTRIQVFRDFMLRQVAEKPL